MQISTEESLEKPVNKFLEKFLESFLEKFSENSSGILDELPVESFEKFLPGGIPKGNLRVVPEESLIL